MTHASIVNESPTLSEEAAGTLTEPLVPSNEAAEPLAPSKEAAVFESPAIAPATPSVKPP